MSRDTLSDLLRSVRLRGAVFFYVSFRDQWSAEASSAKEIAEAVMPGCEHVMEYHMIAKGNGWAAVSGLPPVRLSAGDIVLFPQGDRHVMSSAPELAPQRREPEWVFARRNDPRPMPISVYHGVIDERTRMPIDDADAVSCQLAHPARRQDAARIESQRRDHRARCGVRFGGGLLACVQTDGGQPAREVAQGAGERTEMTSVRQDRIVLEREPYRAERPDLTCSAHGLDTRREILNFKACSASMYLYLQIVWLYIARPISSPRHE